MSLSRIIMSLTIPIVIGLTACGAESPTTALPSPTVEEMSVLTGPEQGPTETVTPAPTFTPTPAPEPTATNTRVPTATSTPSPSPTPEPLAQVDETLTAKINVRVGPGTNYPVVTQLEPGQEAVVTGRNEDDSWWQISLNETENADAVGWVYGELVILSGDDADIPVAEVPPPPATPTLAPNTVAETETQTGAEAEGEAEGEVSEEPPTPEELANILRCGKDFCITYQAMVPIWENGGCVGNHSIYITVLEGLPPGKPLDGVVIGDTFNNVEVASGSHGPGRTEITLWSNSMTLIAKRHMDGTPYTSEESFNFTSLDELIPADLLAANGYCEGRVDVCEYARNHNSVCRGHYSWRVTFHKFD